jgi:Tfp pilus assembly protein PilV
VLPRARSQEGFGLIELLMSMTMLNIGILALVAAFQSGAFALQRASKTSTGAAIADIQMERFRAMTYTSIALDSTSLTSAQADATYTGDVDLLGLAAAAGMPGQSHADRPGREALPDRHVHHQRQRRDRPHVEARDARRA